MITVLVLTLLVSALAAPSQLLRQRLGRVVKRSSGQENLILGLTPAQHKLSLDLHNKYRRTIPASNMEKMSYDMALAEMAYNLTQSCKMHHWWPDTWPNQPFETYDIGQNLYAGNAANLNISFAIGAFFKEMNNYDYVMNTCTSGQCGHYTQLVWSDSYLLGCAHTFCPKLIGPDGAKLKDFHYYACNYGHSGNYNGVKPYKEGPACSQCASGTFLCDRDENSDERGLCITHTKDTLVTACQADCKNGGVTACDCTCHCTAEFMGSTCEKVCMTEPGCGTYFPESYCIDYPEPMMRRCPAVCGLCGTDNPQACNSRR